MALAISTFCQISNETFLVVFSLRCARRWEMFNPDAASCTAPRCSHCVCLLFVRQFILLKQAAYYLIWRLHFSVVVETINQTKGAYQVAQFFLKEFCFENMNEQMNERSLPLAAIGEELLLFGRSVGAVEKGRYENIVETRKYSNNKNGKGANLFICVLDAQMFV